MSDDIELPDGPLQFTTKTSEGEALAAILHGRDDDAKRALKAMNYAELYVLREGLETLHTLTCAQLDKVR